MRRPHQLRVLARQTAQLGRRAAQRGGHAGVREVLGAAGRRPGAGVARSRSPRPPPRAPPAARSAPAAAASARTSSAISGGAPSRCSQCRRRRSDAAHLAAPHARLERVDRRRVGDPSRRPQPGQQIGRRPPGSAARAPASTPAPSRVSAERDAPVVADRHAVAGEHLGEQRGRPGVAAQEHRDVSRLDPLAHQLEHLGADQLGLGALAAGLEQPDRAVGPRRDAPGSNSERSRWCSAGRADGA